MKTFTRRWEAVWNGHQIVAENWWNLLLSNGERLIIDGDIVTQRSGGIGVSDDLCGELVHAGRAHQVRAKFGPVNLGAKVGCHIFVDDALVGGDVDKRMLARN